MHIQPHMRSTRGSPPLEGALPRGDYSLALFENQKSALILKRKTLIVSIFGLNYLQNLDVRVSRRKNSQNFTQRGLYSCVFDKIFIEVP